MPRRPGLAESEIKAGFLERAKALHPDSQTGDAKRFEHLREAYDILKDPASRLRHLLVLESGQLPKTSPPSGHLELFSSVCQIAEKTRTLIPEALRASNPLARSVAAIQLSKSLTSSTSISARIADIERSLAARLADLDSSWPQHEAAAGLASEFAFVAKCRHQISECLFELNDALRGIREENSHGNSKAGDLSEPAKTNTHLA